METETWVIAGFVTLCFFLGAFFSGMAQARAEDRHNLKQEAAAKVRAIYETELIRQRTEDAIKYATVMAAEQSRRYRREAEAKAEQDQLAAMKGLGNPYIRHWQGIDGDKYVDRYTHVGTGMGPESRISCMQTHAKVLRDAGYTVTCTIKPPPATRKL